MLSHALFLFLQAKEHQLSRSETTAGISEQRTSDEANVHYTASEVGTLES